MIIAALQHGLGNQLFQYAAARAVAARTRAPLFLDTTHFAYDQTRHLEIHRFNVRARTLPLELAKLLTNGPGGNPVKTALKSLVGLGIHTLTDRAEGFDPHVARLGWFSRMDGMWQTERYFADLRPLLLAELELRDPPENVVAFARRVAEEPAVALHVRRGDLVANSHYVRTVGVLGAGYYQEALTRIKARVPGARVYVFSDDPEWIAQNVPTGLPTEVVSGRLTHSPVEDFAAMRACRHFIIANSTFSWWTAWLGAHPDKQVFAPARFHRESQPWEADLIPANWETVEPAFVPLDALAAH